MTVRVKVLTVALVSRIWMNVWSHQTYEEQCGFCLCCGTLRKLFILMRIYMRICGSSQSFCNFWTHKPPTGSVQECVVYSLYSCSESAVGIMLVLSRYCSLTELLSVCSYCLFFVGSFSGQNFSSVHRRCSSLTLLSGNFHLTLGRGQMWSGREKREHLHIWGCGSWLLL